MNSEMVWNTQAMILYKGLFYTFINTKMILLEYIGVHYYILHLYFEDYFSIHEIK